MQVEKALDFASFGRLPLARRAEAFRMNNDGWAGQLQNIAKHVAS
jgi:hypothetical protein